MSCRALQQRRFRRLEQRVEAEQAIELVNSHNFDSYGCPSRFVKVNAIKTGNALQTSNKSCFYLTPLVEQSNLYGEQWTVGLH